MAIALGAPLHPLGQLEAGGGCTWFLPPVSPLTARRQLIATALMPAGAVTVDAGAVKALKANKSLLPAGVVAVSGSFERGDAIRVLDADGREIARGLSAYGAADARRIMGHQSREIEALLGYRGREELIHRDDLVLS
jgi:glutamate 5-kinase